MAVLAISLLGAGIGSFAGSAGTGWLIGSFIGNALFGKSTSTEGPRLSALTVQSGVEGQMIPIVFGTVRIAGNLIWSSGLKETRTKKKVGGKGLGGSSTQVSYTYSSTFAVGLCEGPIQGIRKIWADSKLIYSNAASDTAATLYFSGKKLGAIRIYPGSETQLADSLIQANVGAANCPAFRGTAYVVFSDMQLADFGNRVPNLTFEIVTIGSGTAPYLVNTFTSLPSQQVRSNAGAIEVVNFLAAPNRMGIYNYTLDGVLAGLDTPAGDSSFGGFNYRGSAVLGYPRLGLYYPTGGGVVNAYWGLNGKQMGLVPVTGGAFTSSAPWSGDFTGTAPRYAGGYVFVSAGIGTGIPTQKAGILRYPVSADFIPSAKPDKFIDLISAGFLSSAFGYPGGVGWISLGDDGLLYLSGDQTKVIGPNVLVLDLDLNIVTSYTIASDQLLTCVVHDGLLLGYGPTGGGGLVRLWRLDSATPTDLGGVVVNQGINVWQLESLGGGLALAPGRGVVSMLPPITPTAVTLGSIVSALCLRCGLAGADFDVTNLSDVVSGFVIGQQMIGRNAIDPLRQAFFFDAVESSNVLKFVKRGGTSIATLTADDLGSDGSDAIVKTTRQQEVELPIEISVHYLDVNNDYQPGSQRARRLTSPSVHNVSLDLPIAMTSAKAAQVADVLLRNAWSERMRFSLAATRKHAHTEPTDIITLPGNQLARIVSSDYQESGILNMEAIADSVAMYSSVSVGNDVGQNVPQVLSVPGPTLLRFLDLPALRDIDNTPGFYLGAAGYFTTWRGAEVGISADLGLTYLEIAAITNDEVMGFATTLIGTTATPHQIDLINSVTVTLSTPGATLASISDASLLAGGNLALLGDEIFQFGSAALVTTGTYLLSRLLRGRFGTEASLVHASTGERFAWLENQSTYRVDRPQAEVGVARLLRATTFGDTLSESDLISITNSGNSQRPWAPDLIGGSTEQSTANWTLSWRRRGRIAWWWIDGVDVGLEEATEAYEVDILNVVGAVVRTLSTTTPSVTYTAAQQRTDLLGWQSTLTFNIYQKSAIIGRGYQASASLAAPRGGPLSSLLLAHNPIWYVYSWPTIADDISANNLDGTFTGTKTLNDTDSPIASDPAHRSVNWGGGYVSVANNPAHVVQHDLSLLVWAKWSGSTGTDAAIIGKFTAAQQSYLLYVPAASPTQIRILVTNSSGQLFITLGTTLNDGAWHQLVGVVRGTVMEIYVDGVSVGSVDKGSALLPNLNNSTAALAVASFGDGTAGSNFVGRTGPCAVFDHALSAGAILALYNSGKSA